MSFSFSIDRPAAPNDPSVDQPFMLQNNISTNGIIGVDHITFGAPNGGTHQFMHMAQFSNPSAINAGASDGSVIYSAAGVADNARAQIYYKNAQQVQIPMSGIKAFGAFDSNANLLNGMNLTATKGLAGSYNFTIASNVISGNNYLVLTTAASVPSVNIVGSYTINVSSPNQFVINFKLLEPSFGFVNPSQFSVVVLQI